MGSATAPADAKRTMAIADRALAKIRDFDQPGDPRTYAAWFTYATNCSPSQNATVNRKIALNGGISADELETIYGYGPADLIAGNIGLLAAGVVDQVGQVKAMVDAAVGAIAAYRANLDNVTQQLDRCPDQQGVRAMVEALLRAAKSMETQNQTFTARLHAARRQITELQDEADSLGVRFRLLRELIRSSDVVSLHVPLNESTRHLIGAEELALMKPTAIIINTSRGPVIDEVALHAHLAAGKIFGAGLDVFDQEPPPSNNPLFKLDNVVLTAHFAGPTWDNHVARFRNAFDNVQRVERGESPLWVVRSFRNGTPTK